MIFSNIFYWTNSIVGRQKRFTSHVFPGLTTIQPYQNYSLIRICILSPVLFRTALSKSNHRKLFTSFFHKLGSCRFDLFFYQWNQLGRWEGWIWNAAGGCLLLAWKIWYGKWLIISSSCYGRSPWTGGTSLKHCFCYSYLSIHFYKIVYHNCVWERYF